MLKFKDISRGSYIYRTKSSGAGDSIWGKILVVEDITTDALIVRKTENCTPVGPSVSVPSKFDDGYWYDVSTLVFQANAAVCPPTGEHNFLSGVAQSYRNYLDLGKLPPMSLDEAVGHVCFIGALKDGRLMLTKSACYVVDYDSNGWVAVFNGYGTPIIDATEEIQPELCVYYFGAGNRQFYPSDEIIDACNDAFEEDVNRASDFSLNYAQQSFVASTENEEVSNTMVAANVLSELSLGG